MAKRLLVLSHNKYILQHTDKSFCANCKKSVDLLCTDNFRSGPAFYICFECKSVAQVGRGEVERSNT